MTDVHTKEQRRINMQQIKGKDTKPEMLVRKFLHANVIVTDYMAANLPPLKLWQAGPILFYQNTKR